TNPNPFAQAGLKVGDQVIAVNGRRVNSEKQFVDAVFSAGIENQAATIQVLRGDQRQMLTIQPTTVRQAVFSADPLFQAGLVMDLRSPHRLVVQRVIPKSAAFEAGLESGDIITQVGNSPVANLDVLTQAIEQASGNNVLLEVSRGRQSRLFTLQDIDVAAM